MNITLEGTAFTSFDVEVQNKSREELDEEFISFDDTLKKTNETQNITYQTTNENENSTNVIFRDPTNGNFVQVALDNSTIEKLKNNFEENGFHENKNNGIILNAEAEAFVSGWFADIAYNREFLKADANNDGKITEDEYTKTYNNFGIDGIDSFSEDGISTHESISSVYSRMDDIQSYFYRTGTHVKSLDDELNHTLTIDKNLDGKISLEEAYKGEGTIEEKVKDNIEKFYSDPKHEFKGQFAELFNDIINFFIDTLESPEKDKDGNIKIDKEKWKEILTTHGLIKDEVTNLKVDEQIKEELKKHNAMIADLMRYKFEMIRESAGINDNKENKEI